MNPASVFHLDLTDLVGSWRRSIEDQPSPALLPVGRWRERAVGTDVTWRTPVPERRLGSEPAAGWSARTAFGPVADRPGLPETLGDRVSLPLTLAAVSNDPGVTRGLLWGMYGTSGTETNPYGSRAAEVWAEDHTGTTGTVVGVIDSGIDYTSRDLYLNIWLNPGELQGLSFYRNLADTDADGQITFRDLNDSRNRSYVSDRNGNGRIDAGDLLRDSRWADGRDTDGNGYIDDLIGWDFANNDNDPYDDNGHGTHVSGTIGAVGGNGTGVAGVNWVTQLAALKFVTADGLGGLAGAVRAIDYFTAATRAYDRDFNRLSRVQYVGTNNSWGGGDSAAALQTAVLNGARAGNLFVAAAGNEGVNNDTTPTYPANLSTQTGAGFEAVLAVAALDSRGALAGFSNYGAGSVDLGAPGVGIVSTLPGDQYASLSGTSMATPFVTGALTLLASVFPQATPDQLRQAVLQSAIATPSLQGRTATGGRLDVKSALDWLAQALSATPVVLRVPEASRMLWGTAGNDRLTGGSGDDRLAGVLATGTTAAALGRGQVDVLTGGRGADTFLLADSRGTFYDDGDAQAFGTGDYLLVTDFSLAEGDRLQLRKGSQYLYRNAGGGTDIYLGNGDVRFSVADEPIARLQGVTLAPDSTGVWLLDSQPWIVRV